MRCLRCGTGLAKDAAFCYRCGTPTSKQDEDSEKTEYASAHPPTPHPYDPYHSQPATYYGAETSVADMRNPYAPPAPPTPPAPPQNRRSSGGFLKGFLISVLVVVVLGIGLSAWLIFTQGTSTRSYSGTIVISQPTAHVTVPAVATPTAVPQSATVLYQANWAGGLDGWTGSKDWNAQGNMLVSDGTNQPAGADGPTILAPYQLPASGNFAIEIKVRRVNTSGGFDPLLFHGTSTAYGWQGYKLTVCDCGDLRITSDDFNDVLGRVSFNAGADWHTYRVEVRGSTMTVIVDGASMLTVHDSRFLSGGQVGIKTSTQIMASSFEITSL
jgi:hypothetical protein